MAIEFITDDARALLRNFDTKIEQVEQKGKITTWQKSTDGQYYTHTSNDWHARAWLKPNVKTDHLVFNIIKPKNQNVSTVVYGYYHGHLIETFLNHFDQNLSVARVTPLPTDEDRCS
jgi:hypothetical protein